jgi:hypothetical protein
VSGRYLYKLEGVSLGGMKKLCVPLDVYGLPGVPKDSWNPRSGILSNMTARLVYCSRSSA